MKKFFYAIAALLMMVSLSSCDTEIKNVKTKNLVGTWDLTTRTFLYNDGTTTTTSVAQGDSYLVIAEDKITTGSGSREVSVPFRFDDPYFYVDGNRTYELVSLTRSQMVLKDISLAGSLIGALLSEETTLTYKRR